jgi:hypothetical protein
MQHANDELMNALAKLWERYPHWRFGQLVCNVAAWAGEDAPGEPGNIDDAALLRAARDHMARLDGRTGGSKRAAV